MAKKQASPRFGFVDSLRGLAILGVIITHVGSKTLVSEYGASDILRKVTGFGSLGVQLFYVVSAFTIMLLYTKRYKEESRYILSFYVRRLMRIAPIYWGGIILYTAVYGFLGSRGWQNSPEAWHYPIHILFLNMTNPFTPSSVVPGGWSISNEVMFYLIFPLLFLLVKNLKQSIIFYLCCVLASPLFELVANQLLQTVYSSALEAQREQFSYRWLPNQLSCFAAGFVLYFLFSSKIKTIIRLSGNKVPEVSYIFSLMVLLIFSFYLARTQILMMNHIFSAWFVFLAIGMYVFEWRLLVNPILEYIGKISFSCYIFHFAIINLVVSYSPFTSEVENFVVVFCVTTFLTVIISSISYVYYESFFMSLTKKIVNKIQNNKKSTNTDLVKDEG
ncbi:acyltransferase family protein [Serratia proteamaculans]|uniref:acyltransferase family protein n=1 Tax=Serratia proteamaculans TaxID=28151 RepID=UPI00101F3A7E|nr:acyltransferase [Serratia proteamaculans]RYM50027.1 hypothetical protein BSQ96_18540 [Serratia proteamaculans]